jgi:hypothetical protein
MPTDRPFNAEEFVAILNRGEFDGRITEELGKLSREELELVVHLLETQSMASAMRTPKIP